jgi:undecaprenyl-diphosphatase
MIFRKNKTLLIIFMSSLLVYLLSCTGIFDGLSGFIARLLYNTFGYTNKWSHTYGPSWFVNMVDDIASLGSRELVLLFTIFNYLFLNISGKKHEAKNFLFTVGFGIVLILIVKSTTSKLAELNLDVVLTESLSNFPSGHTFIATVMYFAIAQNFSSNEYSYQVKKYLFISASIIVSIVGISRVLGGGHTITEVIAGWSLGLCWFIFAQMFLRLDNKYLFHTDNNKQSNIK